MALTVRVDAEEYGRYSFGQEIITARAATDGTGTVTFSLVRADGYGTVATKTGVVAAGKATATFDLRKDATDVDGIFRGRQGKYYVTATLAAQTDAQTAEFDVMVVTVKEFKDLYMRGIDLLASNVMGPQGGQPKVVTGVEIVNVGPSHQKGIFDLTWTFATKMLAWDGGVAVTIDMTKSVVKTPLVNSRKSAYIEVTIAPDELPTSNATESIIIDNQEIEDETLRQFLYQAYDDIRGRLYVSLEPINVDTERPGDPSYDSTKFTDEYADPMTYYREAWQPLDKFFSIKFPYPWVRKVERLEFFFNSSRVAQISIPDWVVHMKKFDGIVEFVPKTAALLSWVWFSVPGFAFLTRWPSIPSAWHFRLTAGLPDLDKEGRQRVRVAVARKAAIEALTLAGLASASGLTGESTSRDGVSESRSYAVQPGGKYGAVIAAHRDFLFGPDGQSGEILRLRQRLLGLFSVTL